MSRRALPASTGPRAVERAFAALLQRLDPATDPQVLRAAELAMLAVSLGHAALDLRQPQQLLDASPAAPPLSPWPEPEQWQAALRGSRWVATPAGAVAADPATPLVLEDGRLYLRRYREYERRLALGLLRIAAQPPPAGDGAALAPLFARLFPAARSGDRQAHAAAQALRRSLLLVTGGPGTGKTTTIARVLLLLLAQARDGGVDAPRIALAAPTGRAADRMAQSLRAAAAQLRDSGVDVALCDALPREARTLHRLLGTIPGSPRFRHDRDNPLPYDVVVVDEASMVDLPLMCKLVEAVADGARLLLLGDPDQLPSVEAGDVLAAIVAATGDEDAFLVAGGDRAALAPATDATAPITGDLFADASAASPLAGHRVHLQRGYRQAAALDLSPLAHAVRDGDAAHALQLLRHGALSGVSFHEDLADPLLAATREMLLAPWRVLADARDPAQALAAASQQRLLTALRDGPQGADALNARIEEALAGAQREPYFHGRLLLVTENSYRHGLFNGDIGVCLRGDDGGIVAWFGSGSGDGVRGFHPAALPAHAGAFAMTVHKAQGSEFDTAWLLLPRHDARTLSRELVYTAITRARSALHVCAGEPVLRAALSRQALRVSGLAARLQAPAVAGNETFI